jgi:DNA-binding MarR family transcriptional regulator
MKKDINELHGALLDIVAFLNHPKRDELLIKEAAISLDRALFPLLVRIERRGPIGIVDLAGAVGRDYTTVSRQVTKLEVLGLVERREIEEDRRVSKVAVTKKGLKLTTAIDSARGRLMAKIFSDWSEAEIKKFARLARKFADNLLEKTKA